MTVSAFFGGLLDDGATADLTARVVIPGGCSAAASAACVTLNAFLERMQSTLYELCRVANDVARGAAQNSYLLSRIAGATGDQSAETTQVAAAVHETAQAAQIVTASTEATRDLSADMRRASVDAFSAMETSLGRLDALRTIAAQATSDVDVVVQCSQEIQVVTDVIDDISTRSQLLGINAAIEAAHAGDGGRGFGIVAQEIKRLAESTKVSTREIAQLVQRVRAAVESAQLATRRSSDEASQVALDSSRVRDGLTAMNAIVDRTGEQMSAIAAAVDEQSTTLHVVSDNIERLSGHAKDVATYAATATRLELAQIGSDVFAIAGRYAVGTFFERVRGWGEAFAAEVEASIEAAVAAGRLRFDDLFDTEYVEITGSAVASLGRLFDVRRASAHGFDPPKYRTAYDHRIDEPLMAICDRHAALDPKLVFASMTDLNGFFIMGPHSLRRDITGNRDVDLQGNRVKRLFEDAAGIAAARVGLRGAENVPLRASRETFARYGVDMTRPLGARPFLRQTYARDTGKIYNDVALAVYVRGARFGSVRIAYDPEAV